MSKFSDLYSSFDIFYKTLLQGNEIEFLYRKKHYYIIPVYEKSNIIAVRLGEAYKDCDIVCTTKLDLYNAQINNISFGELVDKIDIIWNNI